MKPSAFVKPNMTSSSSINVEAAANFSRDFFRALGSCMPGNLVTSPLGALSALAVTQMGAHGDTQREISRSLYLPKDSALLKGDFRDIFSGTIQHGAFEVSNVVYVREDHCISPKFVQALSAASLPSSIESIDSLHECLIKESNNDYAPIKHILSAVEVDNLSRLSVMSTIWFRATWSHRFNPNNTSLGSFYIDRRRTVEVPFMRDCMTIRVANLDHLDAQLMELPYRGGEVSMLLLFPNKRDGLPKLERKMKAVELASLLHDTEEKHICLCLPRFRLESCIDLEKPLKQLGVRQAFSSSDADFMGISSTQPRLHLRGVLQKTVIDVTEAGTGPSTGSNLTLRNGENIETVCVDHPFMFHVAMKDPSSSCGLVVLFSGRLVHPPCTA